MQKTTDRQLVASHRANNQLQNTWIGKVTRSEVFWLILFLNVNDNVIGHRKSPIEKKNWIRPVTGPFRRTEVASLTDEMFMAEKRVTKP